MADDKSQTTDRPLRYEATPAKAAPLLSSFGNYYRVYVEFEAQEVGPRFMDRADAQRFADEIMKGLSA